MHDGETEKNREKISKLQNSTSVRTTEKKNQERFEKKN